MITFNNEYSTLTSSGSSFPPGTILKCYQDDSDNFHIGVMNNNSTITIINNNISPKIKTFNAGTTLCIDKGKFVDEKYSVGRDLYVNKNGMLTAKKQYYGQYRVAICTKVPTEPNYLLECILTTNSEELWYESQDSAPKQREIECEDMDSLIATVKANMIGKISTSLYCDDKRYIRGIFLEDDNSDNNTLITIRWSNLTRAETLFFTNEEFDNSAILDMELLLGIDVEESKNYLGFSHACNTYEEIIILLKSISKNCDGMSFKESHGVNGIGKILEINCISKEDCAYTENVYCSPSVVFPTAEQFEKDFNNINDASELKNEGSSWTLALLVAAAVSVITHKPKRPLVSNETKDKESIDVYIDTTGVMK